MSCMRKLVNPSFVVLELPTKISPDAARRGSTSLFHMLDFGMELFERDVFGEAKRERRSLLLCGKIGEFLQVPHRRRRLFRSIGDDRLLRIRFQFELRFFSAGKHSHNASALPLCTSRRRPNSLHGASLVVKATAYRRFAFY